MKTVSAGVRDPERLGLTFCRSALKKSASSNFLFVSQSSRLNSTYPLLPAFPGPSVRCGNANAGPGRLRAPRTGRGGNPQRCPRTKS